MKTIDISIKIGYCQPDELSEKEQHLVQTAIKATEHSYSPIQSFCRRCGVVAGERKRGDGCQSGECRLSIGAVC